MHQPKSFRVEQRTVYLNGNIELLGHHHRFQTIKFLAV